MKKLVVGCLIAIGIAVVAVVGVVAAGYVLYSRASSALAERDRQVLAHHFSPVARSPRLPEHGTQIILSGSHPISAAENGHDAAEAVSGHFFMDLDTPELTLIEPADDAATKPRVAYTFRGFTSDLELYEDGSVGTVELPAQRASALLEAKAQRSPDATHFAWVDEKRTALVLADAAGEHERVIATGLPHGGYDVIWSLDGRRLFVYVYDVDSYRTENPKTKNSVYVTGVDAPGAGAPGAAAPGAAAPKLVKVWEEPEATTYYLGPMFYVPARDALVFVHNSRLEMIDVAAKKDGVYWAPPDPNVSVAYPELSPDGTKVGVIYEGSLYLLDAATGRQLSKIAADDDPKRREVNSFVFAPHDRILYFASGFEDSVGEVDLVKWTSWSVKNSILYVVNADGTGRRQLADHSVEPTIIGVYEH